MAPPFMQLPAYQSNALLDFTPLNQGIQQYKADAEKSRRMEVAGRVGDKMKNALYGDAVGEALAGDRADLAGLAMQAKGQASAEARANTEAEHKAAQWYGGQAQRVLETNDPKLWGQIIASNPRIGEKLRQAGVDPNDHVGGPKYLMSQAQTYRDPLDIEAKRAGIEKDRAQAQMARMGGGDPMPIKEWRAFQMMNPQQQERYLLMKRAAERPLDTGTEFVRPNAMNPGAGPTPIVRKDVAGAESAKAQGKAQGQSAAELPSVVARAEDALATIEKLRNHPGREYGTGGLGVLPGIPGTAQKDFVELNEQAKGQTFLQAFQLLKGGGAITNIEGEKATKAIARLDRAQSKQGYLAALNDLEQVVRSGLQRAKYRAQGVPTQGVPLTPPAAAAPRAIPPQAVDLLKSDPTPQKIKQFEEVFGPGSAAQHLGVR